NVDECDLGKFLQYIWHAKANAPEDTPRPKEPVRKLKNGKFETVDLNKVYNIIVESPIEEQYPEDPVALKKSDYDSTEAFNEAKAEFKRAI
ncbi:hypothetical protein PHISP_08343, partial [Aspergillus sp. HF37]